MSNGDGSYMAPEITDQIRRENAQDAAAAARTALAEAGTPPSPATVATLAVTLADAARVQEEALTQLTGLRLELARKEEIIARQRERILVEHPLTLFQVNARLRDGTVIAVLPLYRHSVTAEARARKLDKDDSVYNLLGVVTTFVKEVPVDWSKIV